MKLKEALKFVREYHADRPYELARGLGVYQSYICDLETGRKPINLRFLTKFCRHYGIRLSEFFCIAEEL